MMSKKVIKKVVDVYPNGPIYTVIPPIMGNVFGVELAIGDIANCINSRAIIKETLLDGRVISIGLSNYDTDNNEGIIIPEEKKETPVREARFVSEPVAVEELAEVEEIIDEHEKQEEIIEVPEVSEEVVEAEVDAMVEDTPENKYQNNNNKGKNKRR